MLSSFAFGVQVLYDVFPKHIAQALIAGRKVEPENKEVHLDLFMIHTRARKKRELVEDSAIHCAKSI